MYICHLKLRRWYIHMSFEAQALVRTYVIGSSGVGTYIVI